MNTRDEYLMDPIERMEARVEKYILPDGRVECCICKVAIDITDALPADATPYAPPLCQVCYAKGKGVIDA